MKTINDFKRVLRNEVTGELRNTILGMELNRLFDEGTESDSTIHHLEEKIEIIVQMNKNGIDVFKDEYLVGSIGKAFYQYKLNQYSEYK